MALYARFAHLDDDPDALDNGHLYADHVVRCVRPDIFVLVALRA